MNRILTLPLNWLITLLILLSAAIYVTIIERFWIEVRSVELKVNNLPESLQGLRIVLFSDLHAGFFYNVENLHKLVDQINHLQPDVICFTGDLLDSDQALPMIEDVSRELARLSAPYGKYAVLGNHDYRTNVELVSKHLREGGFELLVNQTKEIVHEGGRLHIAGVDDVLHGNPDLSKTLRMVPEAEPVILLVHEPDYAVTSSKYPIQLQLSGHSHAGQVRLPFVGPILTSTLGKTYNAGEYRRGELTIYTTRGIGTTILPVRFFSRPEISLLTLGKQEQPNRQ